MSGSNIHTLTNTKSSHWDDLGAGQPLEGKPVSLSSTQKSPQDQQHVQHALKQEAASGDVKIQAGLDAFVHKGNIEVSGNKELSVTQEGLKDRVKVEDDATVTAVKGDICAKDGASVKIETTGASGNVEVKKKLTVIGTEGKLTL